MVKRHVDDDIESRLATLLRTLVIVQEIPTVEDVVPVKALCWHCCHPFDGPKLQFPVSHDDRTNRFRVVGAFCSWECVKAYNRDTFTRHMSSINSVNIRYYYKQVTGKCDTIRSAPPRVALKAFGGHLTIEEFRKCRDSGLSYELDVTRMVPIVSHTDHTVAIEPKVQHAAAKPVDFADAVCKSDNLRLKRPKPLAHAGRNTLERVLGLNSLIKKKT